MKEVLTETINTDGKYHQTTNQIYNSFDDGKSIDNLRTLIEKAKVGETIIQSWFVDNVQWQVCKCVKKEWIVDGVGASEKVWWKHTLQDSPIDITCNADEGKEKLDLE